MADKLQKLIRDNVNPLLVVIHLSRRQIADLKNSIVEEYKETYPEEFDGFTGVSLYHNIHGLREAIGDQLYDYGKEVKAGDSFTISDRFDDSLTRIQFGFAKRVEHLKIGKESTDESIERNIRKIKKPVLKALVIICDKIDKEEDKRKPEQQKISTYANWLEETIAYCKKSIEKRIDSTKEERERVKEKNSEWRDKRKEGGERYPAEFHGQRRERGKWSK